MGGQASKRSYGTGSLFEYRGAWYGKWRIGERQVKRKVGPMRDPGTRDGLTRRAAEAKLRRMIEEATFVAPGRRLTLAEAGERYVRHVEVVMRAMVLRLERFPQRALDDPGVSRSSSVNEVRGSRCA